MDVRLYDIIYKLTDDIDAALKGMLEPEIVEVVEGRAEVRQIFKVGKSTVIAGCYVTDGRIVRNGGARVWRGGKVIATDKIESLRRFRDDVREVAQNFECGIGLAGLQRPGRGRHHRVLHPARRAAGPAAERSVRWRRTAMSQRTDRVDELLRQEIGALLAKEVADPRIGFATITDVETSPDLRHAKVWVSVIGGKADRDETLRALPDAMPFIRHELGKRLRIKRIPDAAHPPRRLGRARDARAPPAPASSRPASIPRRSTPFDESLPTPVKRLPHEGDADDAPAAGRPPTTRRRPRRSPSAPAGRTGRTGPKGDGPGAACAAATRRRRRAGDPTRMTARPRRPRRPAPRDAVPAPVLERLRARPVTCSRSATRTPTPTRSAP